MTGYIYHWLRLRTWSWLRLCTWHWCKGPACILYTNTNAATAATTTAPTTTLGAIIRWIDQHQVNSISLRVEIWW